MKSTGFSPFSGSLLLVGAWSFTAFPHPSPAGFKLPSHLKSLQGCLCQCGYYPGWTGVVLKHPVDVICAPSGRICGLDGQEAFSGFRKMDIYSRGKCWRKTQMLFSFEEQGGKQLSDPSCLPPGTARAGIHQVFPAMNVAAGVLEPRDTPGLKMELCFCFETCLGLWPSTSIFPSHFLSWKNRRRSPQHPERAKMMTCPLRCPCCWGVNQAQKLLSNE